MLRLFSQGQRLTQPRARRRHTSQKTKAMTSSSFTWAGVRSPGHSPVHCRLSLILEKPALGLTGNLDIEEPLGAGSLQKDHQHLLRRADDQLPAPHGCPPSSGPLPCPQPLQDPILYLFSCASF